MSLTAVFSELIFWFIFSVGKEPDWATVPQRLLETITEEDQPTMKGNLSLACITDGYLAVGELRFVLFVLRCT